MKPWKSLVALTALALSLPFAIHAQNSSDPKLGTGKLNLAKSKFDLGPAPKSETRTYAMAPDGIKQTGQIESATGNTQAIGFTFKRDGKPYPITGTPDYDTLAVTRIGALKWNSNLIRAGKIIGLTNAVESRDHGTLTLTSTYTTPSGQTMHSVRVYDRQ